MRTRSQQASPGGFVSLDSDRAPRRTRSTRSASQSNTQSSSSTQPATRLKTGNKTATNRITRKQTQKAPKQATRRSTRRMINQTSGDDEEESHNNEESIETAPQDDKENIQDDPKDHESVTLTGSAILSESKSSSISCECTPMDPIPLLDHFVPRTLPHQIAGAKSEYADYDISDIGSPLSERSRTPSVDSDYQISALVSQLGQAPAAHVGATLVLNANSTKGGARGEQPVPSTSEPVVAEPITAKLTESAVVALADSADDAVSQTSEVESLSTFAADSEGGMIAEFEQVDKLVEEFRKLPIADLVPCSSATVDPTESLAMPTWLPEAWLPAGDITGSGDLYDTVVNSQATVAMGTSVHTRRPASIFDGDLLVCPPCPLFDSYRLQARVEQRPLTLSLFGAHLLRVAPSSIYDVPPEPYSVGGPLAPVALEEKPELIPGPPLRPAEAEPAEPSHIQSTPSTPVPGLLPTWFLAILSPIPEEPQLPQKPELSSGPCCSSAGTGQEDAARQLSPPFHIPPQTIFVQPYKSKVKKLTKSTVNRKRAHEETNDEDQSGSVTPAANKRRNLGAPGSTPFANRRTPLSRRLSSRAAPLSSRLARREADEKGRIESTLFRLPDYLRQLEADRQKAETALSSASPQLPQTTFDFTVEPTLNLNQSSADESCTRQEPSTPERNTPETPRSGWNIRGLLSSVPRSFSRLLPFGRSSERSEARSSVPSSERIIRSRSIDTEPTDSRTEPHSRRRLSEQSLQPPTKRARNLSYSLFPAPIDRSLYLGDIPKPPAARPVSSESDSRITQETAKNPETQETAVSNAQTRRREASLKAVSETGRKKRKRSPSPDVIPNPVGASYGMDLDYFCYSSESDDEATGTPSKQNEPKKIDGLAKTAVCSVIRSERQSSKKVRFDASPEDTPSKLRTRARATDPYRGTHFIGMGSGSTSAPTTPTPATRDDQPQRYPGFIPNTQGTFQLDYDAFSDDSDSSGPPSPTSIPAVSPAPGAREEEVRTPTQLESQDAQYAASRQISKAPPSTPGKVDEEALARVRSQAEKYKPKTPSGLRTASRYSSPMTATPDTVNNNLTPAKSGEPAQSEKAEEPEAFGGDEFACDAEWLYQNCPSGDLNQLTWPVTQSYEESVGVSSRTVQLLASIWDDSEVDAAYVPFRHSFEEFKKILE